MSQTYPEDTVIKRYIGACLERLRQSDEAMVVFQDILSQNPNDLPSRQYLGKIYLKKGEFEKAEKEFLFLAAQSEEQTFSSFAQSQLDLINRLSNTSQDTQKSELTSEQFLKTKAAQYFMDQEYEKSLTELKELEKTHPQNLLIKRYIALSLSKLGRFQEAINLLNQLLLSNPNHIPLRFSLAQVYLQYQNIEAAREEFQAVIRDDSSGAYKNKAEKELIGLARLEDILKREKPKKWSFGISSGTEHHSNVTSESRIPEFRSQAGQRAWRFTSMVNASYELLKNGGWSFKLVYNYYQAFHTHSLSQVNLIANSIGASATYVRLLKGKPFVFQTGHTTSQALVRDDYYSASFSEYITAIYSPAERYKIIVSNRFFNTKYALEGLTPDITSRDGFGNLASWSNYFYLNREKSFYYILGFDYQRDQTQGVNYIRNSESVKTGFHFPIYKFCEGEVTFRFKESGFPKYSSTGTLPERSREEEYNLETGISKKLTERWTLAATYKLTMTDSQYDLYTYTNNALGFSISYNY